VSQEQEITISDDGVLAVAALANSSEDASRGVAHIRELVEDPDVPVATISRLIGLEIVDLLQKMTASDPLTRGRYTQRDLNDQVKAFRELQKTLTESDLLSRKDTLNMDGPKFQYVFSEIVGWMVKALEDTKMDSAISASVMTHFRDIAQRNEPEVRKALNKMEVGR
jgi:hypothetical protein